MRLAGILLRSARSFPPKHAVRTVAEHVPVNNGSRMKPSSAVPTIPSAPRSLNEKSPILSSLVGSDFRAGSESRRMYLYSCPAKMNSFFLMIGPLKFHPKLLKRSLPFTGEKKSRASSLSFRKYSKTPPWYLFPPLLVTTLIAAPEFRPYSAEKLDV